MRCAIFRGAISVMTRVDIRFAESARGTRMLLHGITTGATHWLSEPAKLAESGSQIPIVQSQDP